MKIYKVGEKSRGLCHKCKKIVPTTFRVSTVPLLSGRGEIDGILAAICNSCDQVVSLPQQSAAKIRESMSGRKYSIEARLPLHFIDILINASDRFAMGSPETLKDALVRYYIGKNLDSKAIGALKSHLKSDLAKGKSDSRLSLKVNEAVYERFMKLLKKTKLTKTELVKAIVLQIHQDILLKPSKKQIGEIEKVMLASA